MEKQDDTVAVGHQVLTIPNVISIIRLAGVPLFLWLVLVPEADGWALAVLFVSGVSDYADGYLARRLNQTSKVGEILDPVADRLYILSTVIGLAARLYGWSAKEALLGCTLNAAWVLGCSERTGSLEPGKHADLLVLDSPVEDLPHRLGRSPVAVVVRSGEVVWVRPDQAWRVVGD